MKATCYWEARLLRTWKVPVPLFQGLIWVPVPSPKHNLDILTEMFGLLPAICMPCPRVGAQSGQPGTQAYFHPNLPSPLPRPPTCNIAATPDAIWPCLKIAPKLRRAGPKTAGRS